MKSFTLGYLSSHFSGKLIIFFIFQAVLLFSLLGYRSWKDSSTECVRCHGDKTALEKSGFQEFYVTNEMVRTQSKHRYIECRDCHLGDGRAEDKEKAHKGMLKAVFVGEDGSRLNRLEYTTDPLLPTGDNRIYELLPKVEEAGYLYFYEDIRNILWHDRDPDTFNFDPEIAEKTCSKKPCHPNELEQFSKTVMGINYRQRFMKNWIEPYGPHNCGPSFADLPPGNELKSAALSFNNTEEIMKSLNVPFTREQAGAKQKFCNVCHAGCLDCHYTPSNEEGVHSFTKIPKSESCAGFGRGTSICHPGAMQSRRGETYIGGDYSVPPGMTPDVHYEKDIHCVDCHLTGEKGMGDIERKATCRDCHIEIEEAHGRSIHKNMDCASCHIAELRGYQLTVWGPGIVAKQPNPFKKYSLYYGMQKPPVLLKDQNGIWRPYKIWPHSLGNFKYDIPPSSSVKFRWPEGETADAYYIVGTFDDLPANNKHLLWFQIEQASHPYGRGRECESCHTGKGQVSSSSWEFYDNYGAEPFKGEHRIVADSKGLRIEGLKNTTEIKRMAGFKTEDFASWLHMRDRWKIPGDFSIKVDVKTYEKYLSLTRALKKELEKRDNSLNKLSKKQLKEYKFNKGIVLHNPDESSLLNPPVTADQ